jgi:hypothetical protein
MSSLISYLIWRGGKNIRPVAQRGSIPPHQDSLVRKKVINIINPGLRELIS